MFLDVSEASNALPRSYLIYMKLIKEVSRHIRLASGQSTSIAMVLKETDLILSAVMPVQALDSSIPIEW
jgi:hypothetical protein